MRRSIFVGGVALVLSLSSNALAQTSPCYIAYIHGHGIDDTPATSNHPDQRFYEDLPNRLWGPPLANRLEQHFVLANSGNVPADAPPFTMIPYFNGPGWMAPRQPLPGGCQVRVIGYNAKVPFYRDAITVTQQLVRFINDPDNDPTTTGRIPNDQLILIGHSMGGNVIRWILNNGASTSSPYYNYDGAQYSQVVAATRYAITLGTPHSGTLAADAVFRPTFNASNPGTACQGLLIRNGAMGIDTADSTAWAAAEAFNRATDPTRPPGHYDYIYRNQPVYLAQTQEMQFASVQGSWYNDQYRTVPIYTVSGDRWDEAQGDPAHPTPLAARDQLFSDYVYDPLNLAIWGCVGQQYNASATPPLSWVPGDGQVSVTSSHAMFWNTSSYQASTAPPADQQTDNTSQYLVNRTWTAGQYVGSGMGGARATFLHTSNNHNHIHWNDLERPICNARVPGANCGISTPRSAPVVDPSSPAFCSTPLVNARIGTYIREYTIRCGSTLPASL